MRALPYLKNKSVQSHSHIQVQQRPRARGVVSAPDVMSSVWRMRQQCAWWHSLSHSFRYVVPQFHLPPINSISEIINLLGQPCSETPCRSAHGKEREVLCIGCNLSAMGMGSMPILFFTK